jgi:transcriptional regulator with XRE-family HTH domain
MVLTNLIKCIRVDSHLTQVELAEKIKKAQSYISKYESGQRKLDIFEIKDICNSLDMSLVEFVQKFDDELANYDK